MPYHTATMTHDKTNPLHGSICACCGEVIQPGQTFCGPDRYLHGERRAKQDELTHTGCPNPPTPGGASEYRLREWYGIE